MAIVLTDQATVNNQSLKTILVSAKKMKDSLNYRFDENFQENKILRGKLNVCRISTILKKKKKCSVKKLFLVHTFGQQKRTLRQIYMNFSQNFCLSFDTIRTSSFLFYRYFQIRSWLQLNAIIKYIETGNKSTIG